MKITRDNSVAIIIDIQERLLPAINNNQVLQDNVYKLLKGLKLFNVPIITTQQYTKGLGETSTRLQELISNVKPIEKLSFSCYQEPSFKNEIAKTAKKIALIIGIEAHVCVLQTVIDLIENGYTAVVVSDCISSRTEENKSIALIRMQQEGAIITSYESLLFELCTKAGTEEFKALSAIVK